jgi:hypothetical protein
MPDRRVLRRLGQQHIHVITRDGAYQHLTPPALDVLLEKNHVMRFKRSSGWVTAGIDPIRVKDRREAPSLFNGSDRREASRLYNGPDRRSAS